LSFTTAPDFQRGIGVAPCAREEEYMRSAISHVRRTLAVLAVAAIPAVGFAQAPAAAQPNPAGEHLAAARSALNKVLNAPAPTGDAFKMLSDLKTEYIALERAASTASPEWATRYAAIDRLIGALIGPGPAAAGEAGAVGTSGQAGAAKGLDPGIAANLQTFRTELKAFSTAMSAVAPPPTANTSTAAAGSAASGPAPKATPLSAPAAPGSAAASPAVAADPAVPATSASASVGAPAAAAGDASLAAQIDPVVALVDAALAASAVDASGKMLVDRAALQQIKMQLLQIKQGVKTP
jgi:DNA polymerase-3 subunit gamma/tau